MKRVSFFDVVGASDPKSANERPSRLETRRREDDGRPAAEDFFDICESRMEMDDPSLPVTTDPEPEDHSFSFKFDDETTHGTLSSDHLIGRTRSREVPRMRKEQRMRNGFRSREETGTEHTSPARDTPAAAPDTSPEPVLRIQRVPPQPAKPKKGTSAPDTHADAPSTRTEPPVPSRDPEPKVRIRAATDRPVDRTPNPQPDQDIPARDPQDTAPVEDPLELDALESALESKLSSIEASTSQPDSDDEEWDPFEDFEVKLQKI